jgi:hypothetical protein
VEVKVRLLELLGALALLVIINLSLVMVVNASESAVILSTWSFVTSGTAETVSITFVIRGITVNYYADVKSPPWFVKVYVALMSYSCTKVSPTTLKCERTGGSLDTGLAKRDVTCYWPGQIRGYYVDHEKRIKTIVTPGADYWTWDGEWELRINKDICFWSDATDYNGNPFVYAIHETTWYTRVG